MDIRLDHFFILTEPDAPQSKLLIDIGMIEGGANIHPGQGTANRRFFFDNSMLEFLYIQDTVEANNGVGSPLHLVKRVAGGNASPFGIIVRADTRLSKPPFPGWAYHPDYMATDEYLHIGENSNILEEPLCVYAPFDLPGNSKQPKSGRPYDNVTELRISLPINTPSRVLKTLSSCSQISFQHSESHLMEVVFNGARKSKVIDFRPALPLVISF